MSLFKNDHFAILKISVASDDQELKELYTNHIKQHNDNITKDDYPNAGFDIFVPQETTFKREPGDNIKTTMLNHRIKTEMVYYGAGMPSSCAFLLYPRSSLSKTPLILANHTGIIDSGYRGDIIGAFKFLDDGTYTVPKHTRLLQICHPSLCPFYVKLVEEDELSTTLRGEGGFGSTGVIGSTA